MTDFSILDWTIQIFNQTDCRVIQTLILRNSTKKLQQIFKTWNPLFQILCVSDKVMFIAVSKTRLISNTSRLILVPFLSPVKGTQSSLSLWSIASFSRYCRSLSRLKAPVAPFVVWSFCLSPAGSRAFWVMDSEQMYQL